MKLPYHFVTIIHANSMISHSCPLQIINGPSQTYTLRRDRTKGS